jgi:hypothetical protein
VFSIRLNTLLTVTPIAAPKKWAKIRRRGFEN